MRMNKKLVHNEQIVNPYTCNPVCFIFILVYKHTYYSSRLRALFVKELSVMMQCFGANESMKRLSSFKIAYNE